MENQIDCAVQKASTASEIALCYPVIRQLRPHLTNKEAFVEQIQRQINQGYTLIFCEKEGCVKAAAGFRFLECLAWGKILYIDDLITGEGARKSGYASKLLTWLIDLAKKEGSKEVHLDSGPHRHEAHRLYLSHEFKTIAHHFSLQLSQE